MHAKFASLTVLLSVLFTSPAVGAVPQAIDCSKVFCPATRCPLGETAETLAGACCPSCVKCSGACPEFIRVCTFTPWFWAGVKCRFAVLQIAAAAANIAAGDCRLSRQPLLQPLIGIVRHCRRRTAAARGGVRLCPLSSVQSGLLWDGSNQNNELSFVLRSGKQSSKSVEAQIPSGQKKNCCSGSGYFAAGWLCCRALQEKTGDGEKEGASVAKGLVTGLNQFGLNVIEIFRDGDDSASECLVACLVAPHDFRSQLPAVPHACGTLVTVPHVTQPDCRRQLQKCRCMQHNCRCKVPKLPLTSAADCRCCMFAAVWLPQTAAASQLKSSLNDAKSPQQTSNLSPNYLYIA
ncbi:hypothetical protein B0H16DRAFT_1454909 [Mycena metata]|uniref:Uncharacterized protein n=1 Tax=Mycena metata TaxID=1033252 RepID=A0AAD7JGN0_9AGAR|nr:hypothetical protein B0H16DRAFT_1454909 [Mycena metata]